MQSEITRRRFLSSATAAALVRPLWCGAAETPRPGRPNIIFLLADDQRDDMLGCAGHPIIKTPVIDRLAGHGVRFRNAFVTTPICAASRASILTGLTERAHAYTFGKPPVLKVYGQSSYPLRLKEAGYRTGFFGKYGVKMQVDPAEMFDEFAIQDRPYQVGGGRHIDEINAERAMAFLRSSGKDRPFCLSVSFSSPHGEDGNKKPGQHEHYPVIPAALDLYQGVKVPAPRLNGASVFDELPDFLKRSEGRVRFQSYFKDPLKYQSNMQAMFGMISGIDLLIGRILEVLREQGQDQNTVIVYAGDNGFFAGERGLEGKWNHFEQSLRVPLIIHDPRMAVTQRGRVVDSIALNIDLAATLLDYAGVGIPAHYQGRSLVPLVRGEKVKSWRTDFLCEHLMEHARIPKWEGVRDMRHMYARYFQQSPPYEFLHDLKADPDELVNLAQDAGSKGILEAMRKRCDALIAQYAKA